MHDTSKQLLELMFREGESVCVSPNKFGYHSVPLEDAIFGETVTLLPPNPESKTIKPDTDKLILVALNPIVGFRVDANCTGFRNFLIEMDVGTQEQQKEYIAARAMPYSAAVFSGGKSLHYLISLEDDLPNEATWRMVNQWCLNIMTLADQNCKNPSRSIRLPGAMRDTGKMQELVEIKTTVSYAELSAWLKTYPQCAPKPEPKRQKPSETPTLDRVRPWVKKRIVGGLDPKQSRNTQWFAIACEFAIAGFSEEDATDILEGYFNEDTDFKKREWKASIRSGFKHVNRR